MIAWRFLVGLELERERKPKGERGRGMYISNHGRKEGCMQSDCVNLHSKREMIIKVNMYMNFWLELMCKLMMACGVGAFVAFVIVVIENW